MKQSRLEAIPAVELDTEAAFDWYERENSGLGVESWINFALRTREFSTTDQDIKNCVRVSAARSPDNSLT